MTFMISLLELLLLLGGLFVNFVRLIAQLLRRKGTVCPQAWQTTAIGLQSSLQFTISIKIKSRK